MSTSDFAELLLKSFFAIHPWERFKEALKTFRVQPVFSYNPTTNGWEVSFDGTAKGAVLSCSRTETSTTCFSAVRKAR